MFELPENMTIYNVGELKEELLIHLKNSGGDPVQLDAAKLKDIDGAGIQLLLSLYKTLQEEDRSLSIQNPNQLLNHLLQVSGAADILYS